MVRVVFEHLAYGTVEHEVAADARLSAPLRIRLAPGVVELDPLEVEVEGREAREARTRGTSRHVITREDLERTYGTGGNLGSALARFVTGARARSLSAGPGASVCIEFRSSRALDDPLACRPPVVIMDGTRVSNAPYFFAQMPVEDIARMEVIPPGEAGVRYGYDSNYGVLLIETVSGHRPGDDPDAPSVRGPITRYDFAVEGVPYDWKRTYLSAFAGTALAVGAAWLASRDCLSFDSLSDHFLDSNCGGARTAGARVVLMTLPVATAATAGRMGGRSERSQGRWFSLVLGAALAGAPGYLLSTTGDEDAWAGADWLGKGLVFLGMPAIVTITDRLFREVR